MRMTGMERRKPCHPMQVWPIGVFVGECTTPYGNGQNRANGLDRYGIGLAMFPIEWHGSQLAVPVIVLVQNQPSGIAQPGRVGSDRPLHTEVEIVMLSFFGYDDRFQFN